jgi:hypothetical protein
MSRVIRLHDDVHQRLIDLARERGCSVQDVLESLLTGFENGASWVVESWGLGPRDSRTPRHTVVQARTQRDNSVLWSVSDGFHVLNKKGDWEYEPIPSSRDDAFIARTRWATAEEAKAAALTAVLTETA